MQALFLKFLRTSTTFFVQLVQSILKYNRGIYMQNVLLRLREVQPSLSSTERQIAQFILENPDETTTLTIRDLARRSFSSPSSVVRICRVNEDSHSQLLQARNATAQDVGIVFSYSGQTMEMIQCIKEMKAGGAPVIAVTRYYPSEVAQLADHVLYVAANESLFRNGAMSSRLSQLNVVDILYTAYASRNHEDTMRRLTKTHIYKPGDPEVLTQP